jgi:RNA polymerase sigma-70 factor (ECF subfamily)
VGVTGTSRRVYALRTGEEPSSSPVRAVVPHRQEGQADSCKVNGSVVPLRPHLAAKATIASESSSGIPTVAELYRQHGKAVYRRILRFFGPDEAEEVLHEVFLKVVEKHHQLKDPRAPASWLFCIATHHCVNHLRQKSRRTELWREQGPGLWEVSTNPDPDTRLYLRQLWRRLSPELIAIGIHHNLDGMTHAEISRLLGCSRRTVGNRLDQLRTLAQRDLEASASGARGERPHDH